MNTLITEWRLAYLEDIQRYVCDDGTFFNKYGKKLNLKPNRHKYLRVRVYSKGKEAYKWAHRLVCSTFVGCCKGFEVHHLDNDPQNNHWTNFEITTKEQNLNYRNRNNNYKTEEAPF